MNVLNAAVPAAAPALRPAANGFGDHVPPMPMRMPPAALLMSPMPVLATMMRHSLQQTALQTASAASNLLDLATSETPMASEDVQMLEDAQMFTPPEVPAVGGAAMVGAAAAALALINMRAH